MRGEKPLQCVCVNWACKALLDRLVTFVSVTENEARIISRYEMSISKAPGRFSLWCNVDECTLFCSPMVQACLQVGSTRPTAFHLASSILCMIQAHRAEPGAQRLPFLLCKQTLRARGDGRPQCSVPRAAHQPGFLSCYVTFDMWHFTFWKSRTVLVNKAWASKRGGK